MSSKLSQLIQKPQSIINSNTDDNSKGNDDDHIAPEVEIATYLNPELANQVDMVSEESLDKIYLQEEWDEVRKTLIYKLR